MPVDYDHSRNAHTLSGPRNAVQSLFADWKPASLLDVGCGTGTWLRAAMDTGILDVLGIDGVAIPGASLLVPAELFRQQDLTVPWRLGRTFELAICLEVAEHLEPQFAAGLIAGLTDHSDRVAFSAACPGQPGQHHVNCQWPDYWQDLFNRRGFICSDSVRWRMWNDDRVEPWYRQNMFEARRDHALAGREPRLLPVVHPDMLPHLDAAGRAAVLAERLRHEESGALPLSWYFEQPWRGLVAKARRQFFRFGRS